MAHHDDEEDKDKEIPESALEEVLDEDAGDDLLDDPLVAELDPDEERGGW